MKLIHFVLVVLIAYIPCNQALTLDKNKEETLQVSIDLNYIYINLNSFSSSDTIYLKLECENGDIRQSIYYGFDSSTHSTYTPKSQSPFGTVSTSTNSESTKTYYYSFDYQNDNYIVVKFENTYGSIFNMKLEATDSNPISSLVTIILAVVFSIIGLVIIIVVIVCVCICRRRKRIGYVQGPMAPQTPLMYNNQVY